MVFRPATWIVLVGCSLGGVVWAVRTELQHDYYARHDRWNEAPQAFVGACSNAVLLGVGAGMAVWLAIMIAAAIIVRIQT